MFKLVLFLFVSIGFSQNQTDTIPAFQYFKKADSLFAQKKLDSAVVYFKKALPVYKKAEAWEQVVRCYDKISESHKENDSYNKATNYAKKALKVQRKFFRKSDVEEQEILYKIGIIYHLQDDYKNALKQYFEALKLVHLNNENFNLVAKIYSSMAAVLYNTGKLKQAEHYQRKAIDLTQSPYCSLRTKSISSFYNNMGRIYSYIDKLDEGMKYHKKALSMAQNDSTDNYLELAFSFDGIGIVHERQGNYNKALICYKKRLKYLRKAYGKDDNRTLKASSKIGIIYRKMGRYDLALKLYNKELKSEIEKNNEESLNVANLCNNLGVVYKYKGQYNKALTYFKKSILINSRFRSETNHYVARNYNNVGKVFELMGLYEKSLYYFNKSLDIRKKIYGNTHGSISESYDNIGIIYRIKEQCHRALSYLEKSHKIKTSIFGLFHPETANSYENIGTLYLRTGNIELSLQNYQEALDIRLTVFGEHHPKVALLHNYMAEAYFIKEDFKNALLHYKKAVDANLILDKNYQYLDQTIILTTLKGQAKTYEALYKQNSNRNNLSQAIKTYQKADTIINRIRQSFTNYQDKIAFAKTAKEIYQGAIAIQLLHYKIDKDPYALEQAFYYAERSKANTLNELLHTTNAINFTGLPTTVTALEKELRIDYAFYQSQLTKELSAQEKDAVKISEYEGKIFDIGRRQDSLTEVLENQYPKYYQLKHKNNRYALADIQKKLTKNKTMIEFFTSDSTTYVFTISKEAVAVKELLTPKLKKYLEEFRETITSKNLSHYKASAYQLYQQLLAPVAHQLIGDELIIVPDGPLWHLNFDLLLTQNDASNNPKKLSYLLNDFAITYANSANLLFPTTPTDHKIQKREECLAFSFSDSSKGIDNQSMSLAALRDAGNDLPGTRKEIRAISEIIDGRYYYGSEAKESNFKKNANRYNILHLALHGEVDNERPENSKLYFTKAKDTVEDNFLYSHELFALDIPAELTVLSACNTGTGKIAKGEGIMSLGNAFQYAGTKSLLLSSWEVSDHTTPQLMKYFYSNLKKGTNKAKALQQAKLQYLYTANPNRAHPFYWGGFYLVGDAAPIQFAKDLTWYWVLGALIFIFLLGGLFWYVKPGK
ncbi:CHAT domain-containing protein [Aquimarina sp. U1-2]|uniref:CHAT domain-containing protein n=1 Tax=Aquimarina sp. U1-2 TaxID=2823141 RepID=UPI001AEC83D3|nr:CHAT domain-containing tetratricopeptide repeat protein [Aquimarina sp. U1-2]MBP2831750.1 CHAT domain-containing protein [Aquimarina sp. U1-2]